MSNRLTPSVPNPARPAAIQYLGMAGITEPCVEAVEMLLHFGRRVSKALLLTSVKERVPATPAKAARVVAKHCLLLTLDEFEHVAVKSGFSSGYGGEGPSGLSFVLNLLDAHQVHVDEREVGHDLIERVDECRLTEGDLADLDDARPAFSHRWRDYTRDRDDEAARANLLWRRFPLVVPMALVDPRLVDLALDFWDNPNDKLRTAFVRLEEVVRARTGLSEHGANLFRQAFQSETAPLVWQGLDDSERSARALLFESAFRAHRNPRAHRELKEDMTGELSEFLLVNHLFALERDATSRKPGVAPPQANREVS